MIPTEETCNLSPTENDRNLLRSEPRGRDPYGHRYTLEHRYMWNYYGWVKIDTPVTQASFGEISLTPDTFESASTTPINNYREVIRFLTQPEVRQGYPLSWTLCSSSRTIHDPNTGEETHIVIPSIPPSRCNYGW